MRLIVIIDQKTGEILFETTLSHQARGYVIFHGVKNIDAANVGNELHWLCRF
jgi:hypothetical protein